MRYLLIGNAPIENLAETAKQADVVIQINTCPHAEALSHILDHYIFLTNSGEDSGKIVESLYSKRTLFPHARMYLARNPFFYSLKKHLMHAYGNYHWRDYKTINEWKQLRTLWPVRTVSSLSSMRLEKRLLAEGMPKGFMPSTGMIAYDWLCHHITPSDSVTIEGFTFKGWDRHPWEIEKKIIKSKAANSSS